MKPVKKQNSALLRLLFRFPEISNKTPILVSADQRILSQSFRSLCVPPTEERLQHHLITTIVHVKLQLIHKIINVQIYLFKSEWK